MLTTVKAWLTANRYVVYLITFILIMACVAASGLYGYAKGSAKADLQLEQARTELERARATNAIESIPPLIAYTENAVQRENNADDILTFLESYTPAPEQKIVYRDRIVQVPGQPEYVYVPTDACPPDVLSPDELRLLNWGADRAEFESGDPRELLDALRADPSGRE